jgi:hypothetical protein
MTIPDAPWIREAERYGYDEADMRCPVCGEICSTIYTRDGEPVGCSECLGMWEPDEWHAEHDRRDEQNGAMG